MADGLTRLVLALGTGAMLLACTGLNQPGFGEESGTAASGNTAAGSAGDQSGARPGAHDDAKSNGAQPPADSNNGARDGNSSSTNGNADNKSSGDDGVPSRRINGKPDKTGLSTAASLRNPHRRTFHPSKVVTQPARNAIGASLPRNEPNIRSNIARPNNTPTAHPVTGVETGGVGSPNRFTKVEGSTGSPVISNPAVRPVTPNRGAINGSTINRPGAASAQLGGPTKTTGGLSGSAFRPKY
jgi:hypothetical protein